MNMKTLRYWIPTVLAALALTGSGVMNVLSPDMLLEVMAHLEFPAWFPRWLGMWKLAGVAVLLAPGLPRLKEWATAGFTISLTSAAVAHIAVGDPIDGVIAPLVILGLVLTSWHFRPDSRRLAGPSQAPTAQPQVA